MRSPCGYSLAETLVVIGILMMLGVLVYQVRPAVVADARAVSMIVRGLRSAAIVAGRPQGIGGDGRCGSSEGVERPPGTTARLVWPPRGLLFTPDGLARTCDGGGVGNTTILLEHRGRQAAVIVSSLGRVRWEMR